MQNKNYTVYKLTFPNNKVYIGQTSKMVQQRWKQGNGYRGQKIYKYIIQFGWQNIKKEILHTNLSSQQADELEKYYIEKFNSKINGYNETNGGKGCHTTNKIKNQISTKTNIKSNYYINRMNSEEKLTINFIADDTFNVLSELESYGAVLVYFYLCSLIPHTYDGKLNSDYKNTVSKPYELSPQAIKNAYGKHSINTYRDGINKLIEKGFLKKITDNLYQFDDIPLKYRVKTYDEKIKIDQLNAEQAFEIMHNDQLKNFNDDNNDDKLTNRPKYEWED